MRRAFGVVDEAGITARQLVADRRRDTLGGERHRGFCARLCNRPLVGIGPVGHVAIGRAGVDRRRSESTSNAEQVGLGRLGYSLATPPRRRINVRRGGGPGFWIVAGRTRSAGCSVWHIFGHGSGLAVRTQRSSRGKVSRVQCSASDGDAVCGGLATFSCCGGPNRGGVGMAEIGSPAINCRVCCGFCGIFADASASRRALS